MLGMGTNGNFYELRGESILELKLKRLVFVPFFMRLTLDYDYMFSETDFTKEKNHSHPTTGTPNS